MYNKKAGKLFCHLNEALTSYEGTYTYVYGGRWWFYFIFFSCFFEALKNDLYLVNCFVASIEKIYKTG